MPPRAERGPRPRRPSLVALVCAALCFAPAALAPRVARADTADAKELFHDAQAKFDAGEFDAALPMFKSVYEQTTSPNARLYVARSLRELGRTVEAYEEMAAVAKEAAQRAEAEEKYAATRDAAVTELAPLEAKVGRLTIALAEVPKDTEVTVNDEPIPLDKLGAELAFLPGTLVIKVQAPNRDLVRKNVDILGGEARTIAIALPTPRPDTGPTDDEPDDGGGGMSPVRMAGIGMAGLGAAGLVVFAITGSMSRSKFDEVEAACGGVRCTDPSYGDEIDSGKSLETIANITLVAGGVLLVAGVTMIILGEDEPSAEARALTPRVGVSPLWTAARSAPEAAGSSAAPSGAFVSVSSAF